MPARTAAAAIRVKAERLPRAPTSRPIGRANIPTPRDKTLIIGQVDFQVFNSFNTAGSRTATRPATASTRWSASTCSTSTCHRRAHPWLATEYKYNDDFTELTFKFDPKAKWNDGQPFTSKDFKFTVELHAGPPRPDRRRRRPEGLRQERSRRRTRRPRSSSSARPNPRLHYDFICRIAGGCRHPARAHLEGPGPDEVQGQPAGAHRAVHAGQGDPPTRRCSSGRRTRTTGTRTSWTRRRSTSSSSRPPAAQDAASAGVRAGRVRRRLDRRGARQAAAQRGLPEPHHHAVPRPEPTGSVAELRPGPRHDGGPADALGDQLPPRPGEDRQHRSGRSKMPPAKYPWADYDGNDKWKNDELADKYKLEYNPEQAPPNCSTRWARPKGAGGKRMYKGKPINLEMITPVAGRRRRVRHRQRGRAGAEEGRRPRHASAATAARCTSEKFQRGEYDIDS